MAGYRDGLWDSILKDRFSMGFLAGIISYLIPFSWNHISKFILGFGQLTFVDFAAVFLFTRFTQNIYEYIFGIFVAIFWHGFLGVVFAFLLAIIKSKNLLFKGTFYGSAIWFISYAITSLYQIPELADISLNTSLSNFIGAALQGASLGYAFIYLEKKSKNTI